MEDCNIVIEDILEGRVIVEDKTFMDRLEIRKKGKECPEKIGREILKWRVLSFIRTNEDYEKAYDGADPDPHEC